MADGDDILHKHGWQASSQRPTTMVGAQLLWDPLTTAAVRDDGGGGARRQQLRGCA